jgi:hypothetical protein
VTHGRIGPASLSVCLNNKREKILGRPVSGNIRRLTRSNVQKKVHTVGECLLELPIFVILSACACGCVTGEHHRSRVSCAVDQSRSGSGTTRHGVPQIALHLLCATASPSRGGSKIRPGVDGGTTKGHAVARAMTANELGAHWQVDVDSTVHAFSEPEYTTLSRPFYHEVGINILYPRRFQGFFTS